MKKVTIIAIILILLAVAVVPVMAAGNSHGRGNGNGQGNTGGTQATTSKQDQNTNNGARGNGNQQNGRQRTPFYLQGTITAIDAGAKTITVTLIHGNARVKQFIGDVLTISVPDGTMIFKLTQGDETEGTTGESKSSTPTKSSVPTVSSLISVTEGTNDDGTPGNRVATTFSELAVGQKVAIHGNLVNNVFTARLITIYVTTLLGQPTVSNP